MTRRGFAGIILYDACIGVMNEYDDSDLYCYFSMDL